MAKAILADAQHPLTREERALALFRAYGEEITHLSGAIYRVPSQDGQRSYDVEYGQRESCSCPDYLYRGGERSGRDSCVHILALAIATAKGTIRHPELAAGDPFIAGGSEAHRPCACNDGWVSLEVETEDGEAEEVLYLCRRCAEEEYWMK